MDDGSTGRQLFLTAVPADTARVGQADIGSIAIYIILIVLLILGAAWFAACETSLACVNKLRMKSRAEDGDKRAQYVMYILNNYDRALTTMLIGINIMHIACASIATLLTRRLFGGSSHLNLLLTASVALSWVAEESKWVEEIAEWICLNLNSPCLGILDVSDMYYSRQSLVCCIGEIYWLTCYCGSCGFSGLCCIGMNECTSRKCEAYHACCCQKITFYNFHN